MNVELEKQKIVSEDKKLEFDNRMAYIKLKHKHIKDEIELMGAFGIKHFER